MNTALRIVTVTCFSMGLQSDLNTLLHPDPLLLAVAGFVLAYQMMELTRDWL